MAQRRITINQILRDYRDLIPRKLSLRQNSVLGLMGMCRTGELGYMKRSCRHCHRPEIRPQSCGDRHCPQCLGMRQAKWASALSRKLPAVPHFHLVFTLPGELKLPVRRNREVMLPLFFEAVAETMKSFMSRNLKMEGGFVAVLHTWGQTLNWHPHLHLLVPGGGFDLESGTWKRCRPNYLFSTRALSKVFRATFLAKVRRADDEGRLNWPRHQASRRSRDRLFLTLATTEWVVFARATLKHTRSIVRYLAAYTSRIGISNRRLASVDAERRELTFCYTDNRSRHPGPRRMTLPIGNFIARYAQHILPKAMVRVRRYGFLSPASRFRARVPISSEDPAIDPAEEFIKNNCPNCGHCDWTIPTRITYSQSGANTRELRRVKAFPLARSPA